MRCWKCIIYPSDLHADLVGIKIPITNFVTKIMLGADFVTKIVLNINFVEMIVLSTNFVAKIVYSINFYQFRPGISAKGHLT